MKKAIFAAPFALAAASCASAGSSYEMSESVAARLAEFEKTGETETCVNVRRINSITPLDERNFLVRVGVNDYYLNRPRNRCAGADRAFNRLQYKVSGSMLCRNEIVQVVDNSSGLTGGSCGLGVFEKLEKINEGDESDPG